MRLPSPLRYMIIQSWIGLASTLILSGGSCSEHSGTQPGTQIMCLNKQCARAHEAHLLEHNRAPLLDALPRHPAPRRDRSQHRRPGAGCCASPMSVGAPLTVRLRPAGLPANPFGSARALVAVGRLPPVAASPASWLLPPPPLRRRQPTRRCPAAPLPSPCSWRPSLPLPHCPSRSSPLCVGCENPFLLCQDLFPSQTQL